MLFVNVIRIFLNEKKVKAKIILYKKLKYWNKFSQFMFNK